MKIEDLENSTTEKFLFEIKESGNYDQIINTYKKTWKNDLYLFHGRYSDEKIIYKKKREDRRPKDTRKIFHDLFDMAFKEAGFVARRSNSLFCSGDKSMAKFYGNLYVAFPKNEFKITWSNRIADFTDSLENGTIFSMIINKIEEDYYDRIFAVRLGQKIEKFLDKDGETEKKIRRLYNLLRDAKSIYTPKITPEKYKNIQDFVEKNPDLFSNIKNLPRFENHVITNWLENNFILLDISIENIKNNFYPFIVDLVKEIYNSDDLISSLKSKNEIMVHADDYILINYDFFQKKELGNILFD